MWLRQSNYLCGVQTPIIALAFITTGKGLGMSFRFKRSVGKLERGRYFKSKLYLNEQELIDEQMTYSFTDLGRLYKKEMRPFVEPEDMISFEEE